MLTNVISPLYR